MYAIVGAICRAIGITSILVSVAIAQYLKMLKLAHFYGVMFGTWEPPNIEWLLSIIMWTGIALYLFGICSRLLLAKKMNIAFGCSGHILNFCGMVTPFIHETFLAFSAKENAIMSKSIKEMTNAEYALYLRMSE
jgi:hypothetical protein